MATEKFSHAGSQNDPEKELLEKGDWTKYNFFAIMTMKNNNEAEVVTRFRLCRLASEAYRIFRSLYKGKTLIDLGTILANVTKLELND